MAAGGSGRRGGSNPSRPQSVSLNCVASDGCPELNKRSGGRADGRGDTRPSSVYPTGPSWLETSSRPPPSPLDPCVSKSGEVTRWKSRFLSDVGNRDGISRLKPNTTSPPSPMVKSNRPDPLSLLYWFSLVTSKVGLFWCSFVSVSCHVVGSFIHCDYAKKNPSIMYQFPLISSSYRNVHQVDEL